MTMNEGLVISWPSKEDICRRLYLHLTHDIEGVIISTLSCSRSFKPVLNKSQRIKNADMNNFMSSSSATLSSV